MPTGWSACSRKAECRSNVSEYLEINPNQKKNLTPWIPSKFHHVLMSLSSWIKFWRWKRLLKQINAKIPCSLCTWVGDVARCIQMFSHLHTPDILEEIWETNALSEQPMRNQHKAQRNQAPDCTGDIPQDNASKITISNEFSWNWNWTTWNNQSMYQSISI